MAEMTCSGRQYTEDYLGMAIWQAFRLACGQAPYKWCKPSDQGKGVQYGAWLIESSSSVEECDSVCQDHWHLIYTLAQQQEMHNVVEEWKQVLKLQERMQELVGKALKSSDFLYPCWFCKYLWEP
jgi:hypothetical protein